MNEIFVCRLYSGSYAQEHKNEIIGDDLYQWLTDDGNSYVYLPDKGDYAKTHGLPKALILIDASTKELLAVHFPEESMIDTSIENYKCRGSMEQEKLYSGIEDEMHKKVHDTHVTLLNELGARYGGKFIADFVRHENDYELYCTYRGITKIPNAKIILDKNDYGKDITGHKAYTIFNDKDNPVDYAALLGLIAKVENDCHFPPKIQHNAH